METLLEVRDLKKYFPVIQGLIFSKASGWIKAVDRISFSINEGETFGLVGESGCGKSTIAKIILLLERATSGSIYFRGRQVYGFGSKEISEYRASVQAVFQDPTGSLNPCMKIGSIVTEPLVAHNILPRHVIKQRMEETLSQVGLSPEAARLFPHEFSGGQRQRIALARALTVCPKLIILDEPISALDVSIQAQIMNLLKELQRKYGIAYLFIAHNLATVRYMSHRVGVMYLGKLVEQGQADEIYVKRLHPYTQALFSATLPSHPDMIKSEDEIALTGEVPSAYNIPPGCRFHPRCRYAFSDCFRVEPELKEIASGYYVACHLDMKN